MSFIEALEDMVKGAAVGVAAVTALPIFGAIGAITATGVVVGSTVGAAAALADKLTQDD